MALTRINGNLISSGTITGNLFGGATITGDKISLNAITGNLIAAAAITGDKIGLTAITSNLIASGVTLTSPVIASANLTTALTLNGATGNNGQVLTSSGSGLPSWSTPGGGFSSMDVLTSGTSWTVPAGKTLIKIYVTGGGSGGSSYSGSRATGSAGGTAIKYLTVTAGNTATYAIGGGGDAGPLFSPGDSNAGGNSTFTYGGVTYTGNGASGTTATGSMAGEAGFASSAGGLALKGQGGSNSSSGGGGPGGSSFWGGGGSGASGGASGNYGGGGGINAAGYQGVIVIEY